MEQLDPYQAPQADLHGELIEMPAGSVTKAVSAGFGVWLVLFMASGAMLMYMLSGPAGTPEKSMAQPVNIGMTALSNFLAFFVAGKIAHRREWQAALILFVLRMTGMLTFQIAVLHLWSQFSLAYFGVLAQIVAAAAAGTSLAIWLNRRAEKPR